jgi:hypothetical protein
MSISNLTGVQIAWIAFALVVAGGVVVWLLERRRTAQLRARFGSAEYERALNDRGNRLGAEDRLEERAKRVQALHLRSLTSSDHLRFQAGWEHAQMHFVDAPAGAVTEADQLVIDLMTTRGYPMVDFEQRAADISVDHPAVIENYRAAHSIALRQASGQANTEDLRRAMIHYRALFDDLLGGPVPAAHAVSF